MDPILFDEVPKSRRNKQIQLLKNYIRGLNGLVAYYPLDEPSGSTAFNRAPTTLGTFDFTTTGASVNQSGQLGRAYSFDGINDELTRGLVTNRTSSTSTVIVMKSDDYTQNRQGIWSHGISTQGYALILSGNATTDGSLMVLHHGIAWHDTNYNLADNNWHIIVFTLTAAAVGTIYIDGTQIWTATTPPLSLGTPQTTSFIGSDDTGFFKGKLQHFAIINNTLSSDQALRLAQLAGLA